MSVSRSPVRNESLRRREELSDARRTAAVIAAFLATAAFAFVMWLTWMARQ